MYSHCIYVNRIICVYLSSHSPTGSARDFLTHAVHYSFNISLKSKRPFNASEFAGMNVPESEESPLSPTSFSGEAQLQSCPVFTHLYAGSQG